MVQLTLPKNSKITQGKTWAYPAGAQTLREYRIYRWNPEGGEGAQCDSHPPDGQPGQDGLHHVNSNAGRGEDRSGE